MLVVQTIYGLTANSIILDSGKSLVTLRSLTFQMWSTSSLHLSHRYHKMYHLTARYTKPVSLKLIYSQVNKPKKTLFTYQMSILNQDLPHIK